MKVEESIVKSGNVARMCDEGADDLASAAVKSGNVSQICDGGAEDIRADDMELTRYTNAWSN